MSCHRTLLLLHCSGIGVYSDSEMQSQQHRALTSWQNITADGNGCIRFCECTRFGPTTTTETRGATRWQATTLVEASCCSMPAYTCQAIAWATIKNNSACAAQHPPNVATKIDNWKTAGKNVRVSCKAFTETCHVSLSSIGLFCALKPRLLDLALTIGWCCLENVLGNSNAEFCTKRPILPMKIGQSDRCS